MVLSYGTGNAEMVVRSHDVGGGGGVVGDKDDVVEQAGY